MMTRILLFTATLLSLGASNCQTVKIDPKMSAVEARDLTAMIEGCGNQPVSGYTFCRKIEGDASLEELYFVAPASQCAREKSCAEWKVFYPDGSGPIGGEFPKGQTRVSVKWKDLLKRDTFELGDGGFWGVRYTIYWVDKDGFEKRTIVDGEIRLIVNKKGYTSLFEVSGDPNFAWEWLESGASAKMTTGGRAYMGSKP